MVEELVSGIYCFENLTNGKKYVGQAENIEYRIKRHIWELNKNKSNCLIFQNAWNIDKEENFKHYVVEKCLIEMLDEKEAYYIKELKSHVSLWGYNISWGGDAPMRGRKHTQESKEKISIGGKGRIVTDETRKNMSDARKGEKNYNWGQKASDEIREKLSKRFSGENNPNYGKPMTQEQKDKISKSHMGIKVPQEIRDKMSKSHMGIPVTDETRLLLSLIGKGRPKSEKAKENMAISRQGKPTGREKSSKYVGVFWFKKSNKWAAQITVRRKVFRIGYFETEIEAAMAYNEYALEFYGWKATLNIFTQEEMDSIWE